MSSDGRLRARHVAALARLEMRLAALRSDRNELVRAAVTVKNDGRPRHPSPETHHGRQTGGR